MKKFRHLWLSILTLILSVSIIIGGAGIAAFADAAKTPIFGDGVTVTLPSSVELGEKVNVGTNASVKAPNGDDVTLTENAFVAKMLGNYEIEYKKGTNKYDKYTHTVNVKLTSDYELRVEGDGAKIPTYTKPGESHPLPGAVLYEKKKGEDEYKALTENTDYTLSVYVDDAKTALTEAERAGLKFEKAGRHSIQYVAQLKSGSDSLNKYFTKQYEVNAQENFEDTTRPTISISGVPTDASLNTKVTLPKATATDNFDKNVEVVVTVTFDGENVPKAKVDDDYGYAIEALTDKVKFDNVHEMSFYPMKEGTYVVEYYAKDDMGNVSVKQPFNIRVQDRTAPKLEKIDDDKIPSTWGLTKVVKENDQELSGDGLNITFPYPTYSDNSGTEGISVSFEIRDTVNNTSVIKFDNIYDQDGDGSKYKITDNSTYKVTGQESVKFDKEAGFVFNFNNYRVDKDGEENATETPKGVYTVIYNARDKKPNSTTKSYDIDLQDSYTDKIAPSVDMDADKYLYVDANASGTDYTLPTATISDASDTRPTVVYNVVPYTSDSQLVEEELKLSVKNGSDINIKIESRSSEDYVIIKGEDGKSIEFKKEASKHYGVQLYVSATDNVGNKKELTDKIVKLVFASDFASLKLDTTAEGGNITNNIKLVDEVNESKPFKTYAEAKLGGFKVTGIDADLRDYVGFEMYLTNPKGDIIPGLDFETFVEEKTAQEKTTAELNVENIKFTPSVATKTVEKDEVDEDEYYALTIRIFDITGRSAIIVNTFTVEANQTSGGDWISAAPIPASGKINVSYKLKNEKFYATNVNVDKKYIVRKISNAGRFSLMGTEFTAYTVGTVTFEDNYYVGEELTPIGAAYDFTADDNSTPVFELLGKAPVQVDKISSTADKSDKTKWVAFEPIVAYNSYANAKISVNVTNPNGRTYKWIDGMDNDNVADYIDFNNGVLKFLPELDGEYTIEFVASVGSSDEARATYVVRVGDTVPPTFGLGSGYGTTARQNSEFKFKVMTSPEDDVTALEDITFTKRLIDPSGNEVYSVSGKGKTNGADKQTPSADETYTFTMTGRYRVEYTATDKAGNSSIKQDEINVSATESTGATPLRVLRTVLIIVGVILIAGVILYFVRFRKVKAE